MKHSIKDEIRGVLVFLGLIWAVFLVTVFLPSLRDYGLIPRSVVGLAGIPTMVFLHANLAHIAGNTLPLLVLLLLLAGSRANSWTIVVGIVALGGGLLWILGRPFNHIGASGLVFGLIGFLIASGIFERRFVPLLMTGLVALLFGGTLLSGILPTAGPQISWDGHLCGALGGVVMAYTLFQSRATANPKAIWGAQQ